MSNYSPTIEVFFKVEEEIEQDGFVDLIQNKNHCMELTSQKA